MFAVWFVCIVLLLRPILLATQTYSSVMDLIAAAKCEALGLSAADREEKTQWLSQEKSGMLWNDCIRNASRDISIVPWTGESPITEPILICRDLTSFTVGWNLSSTHNFQDEPVLYAVEFHSTRRDIWEPLTTTKDRILTVSHLTPGLFYKLRVTAVMAEGLLGRPLTSSDLRTLSDEKIKPVEYADLVEQIVHEHGLNAVIKWDPSPDKPCYYEVVKWVPDSQESSIVEVKDVRLNMDSAIYMTLSDLEFDTNYSIAITAEAINWTRESDKYWFTFRTPTCLQAHNWSLKICAPQKPEGLTAIASESDEGDYLCDVMVTWDRPHTAPDFYVLSITHYTTAHWIAQKSKWLNTYQVNSTVNGSLNSAVFRDLEALPRMMVTLIAVSEGGKSKEAKIYRNSCILTTRPIPQNYSTDTSQAQTGVLLWSVTAFCLFITLSTAAIFVFICRYQSRRKQKKKRAQYFKNLEKDETGCREWTNHKDIDEDEFEIARDRILISHLLGTGAFGVVHKGLLTNGAGPPTEIAVKTLRDNPAGEEMRQLTKEISILKSVGRHRNIASMLGCCTRGSGNRPLLIIEFCSLGDLQNFLRQTYKIMSRNNATKSAGLSESEMVTYADLMTSNSCDSQSDAIHGKYETLGFPVVMNKTYDIDNSKLWYAAASLSASDLLSFTRQIAIGMEFLAKNKVVHRDLAARNVLVCSDLTMKISDFGLSRDIYEQNFYSKKGSERLPVKWMAIESFLHQIYTTQSDVWSFGVLLWEIVTLGGNPYPSIPTSQIFRLLKQGYRMEKPSSCGKELYDIMLACWTPKPKDRPTFSQLLLNLDELLERVSPQEYLNLNIDDLSSMEHTDSVWD